MQCGPPTYYLTGCSRVPKLDQQCSLCARTIPAREIKNHLGRHLQQLALYSLPGRDDLEEVSGNLDDVDSGSGNLSTRNTDSETDSQDLANVDACQGGEGIESGCTGGVGRTAVSNEQLSQTKGRIWNTLTNDERERLKECWLSLGEDDRRSLVKVEKEAVLQKMKEQQKHTCSCGVCARKQTAIEEELEVLYDSYYEDLKQYANQQQSKFVGSISPLPPHFSTRGSPPPPLGPLPNRIEALEDDEDYEDDDDYEEDDDDAVEDDLLKNDGKKFIEMMEQLAERRMQREEDAKMSAEMVEQIAERRMQREEDAEDAEDGEDEEDYEYGEEEEEDEASPMTEEQRMEEGRRMFEQRVIQAYREKAT